jgi:two-component sensor histidine kinase
MADSAGAADRATRPAQQARRSRPIALYLFILALVALVPAFVFSAVLLQRNNEAQERVVETLITGTSRSIVQAVEREIVANITTLRVLGSAPALSAGDFQSFHTRVKLALAGTDTYVYLLNSNLMTIMSTRVDYGAPLSMTADPESSQRALETGNVVVSNVLLGAVSRRWVFNILLPLSFAGQEPMVLGLNRNADGLSAALLSNKMPDGWNVAMIDSNGAIIAASPGAGNPGEHFPFADVVARGSSIGWIDVRAGDADYLAVIQRSGLTGWTLFAWAPRDVIARPLATAFWSLLVGGILLAAVVVLVVYWVSLQIGRSVHGVASDAKLLGAGHAVPARNYPIAEIATVSDAIADASRQRKAAESEVRLLMRELAHRSKNQITVIAAMAKQSAKGESSVPAFVSSFERRIHSLARSTDLLLAHGISGIQLKDVLIRQIDPLCPLDSGRVELRGPGLSLNTQAAQILGMAAHELATNAVKHGAFATETGTLEVVWSIAGDTLTLTWRERLAALPAKRSRRRGFGTTVLEHMVGRSLGATVAQTLHEDGIEWRFEVALASLEVQEPADGAAGPESAQPTAAMTRAKN